MLLGPVFLAFSRFLVHGERCAHRLFDEEAWLLTPATAQTLCKSVALFDVTHGRRKVNSLGTVPGVIYG